jgi:hypothetical protein
MESAMPSSLPLYRIGNTYVEAFMIIHIDRPGSAVVLWGPNDIRIAVTSSYLVDHRPYEGGYYVSFPDGAQTFVSADDFDTNFKPAE